MRESLAQQKNMVFFSSAQGEAMSAEYLESYVTGAVEECKSIIDFRTSPLPAHYWQGKIDAYQDILRAAGSGLLTPCRTHQVLILEAQSVNHTLSLVEAEEARAWQRCNDLRARLAEDVQANIPAYHEAMDYHRHTGGALQVLRRLQMREADPT
jgi:hypothetical protein